MRLIIGKARPRSRKKNLCLEYRLLEGVRQQGRQSRSDHLFDHVSSSSFEVLCDEKRKKRAQKPIRKKTFPFFLFQFLGLLRIFFISSTLIFFLFLTKLLLLSQCFRLSQCKKERRHKSSKERSERRTYSFLIAFISSRLLFLKLRAHFFLWCKNGR